MAPGSLLSGPSPSRSCCCVRNLDSAGASSDAVAHRVQLIERFIEFGKESRGLLAIDAVDRLLADGADKANELAEATLAKVYDAIGFLKAKS